jgi:hypothetical protein
VAQIGQGGGGGYTYPVPGGTVGRTDQGVDISAPPGTPVFAITNETLVGVIQNWYKGQPYYWFREAGTNVYNFVAEQFKSNLRVGQSVTAGEQIGEVAPSGTGLELGWATASGQTLAKATTGYKEGQVTKAGQSYRNIVIRSRGGAAPTYTGTRPGGDTGSSGGDGSGDSGGDQTLQNYTNLLDTPRTAPPGTKNPFQWWLASFTGNWKALGSGASSSSDTSGGSSDTGATLPSGGKTHGQVSYDMVAAIGQNKGWSKQQIDDWFYRLIPSESPGTITAQNPTSPAYGIAQFIDGPKEYYTYGGNPNTVQGQLIAMANYIAHRYGNPSVAWAFHQKHNWY